MRQQLARLVADAKRQARLLRDLHQNMEADGGSIYHLRLALTVERLARAVEKLSHESRPKLHRPRREVG